ncbi:hypothetical protein FACS1894170_12250 [Planctomycetales bacterium]|nr:hypothetical protein FACS1894170_12250 [Planctomycetales bacterium]
MFCRIAFVFSLAIVFSVCVAMFAARDIFGEIKPETVDRQTFVRIMQFRDFRQCSPELVVRILQRAETEFGSQALQKPVFGYSPLEKRVFLYFEKHRGTTTPLLATNLDVMAQKRFFLWIKEYDSATKSEKAVLMKRYVEELHYWQTVYFQYLQALDQPCPNAMQLLEDFQNMIARFKIDQPPETVAV